MSNYLTLGNVAKWGGRGLVGLVGAVAVGAVVSVGVKGLYKNLKPLRTVVDGAGDFLNGIGKGISNIGKSFSNSPKAFKGVFG